MRKRIGKYVADIERAIEQIIKRERLPATFFSRCLISLSLRIAILPHVNAAVAYLAKASRKNTNNK